MTTIEGKPNVRPDIVENFREFELPKNFRKQLDELLGAVPPKYLVGLKTILLTNQGALTRSQRRQKTWSRNHKIRLAQAGGFYRGGTRSSPASICLYVDNILQWEQPWQRRIPIFRYEALGTVLYHEIGHHIHAVHKPIFDNKENVAEEWSRKLFGRFVRLHYWYLAPIIYPLGFVIRVARRFKKWIA